MAKHVFLVLVRKQDRLLRHHSGEDRSHGDGPLRHRVDRLHGVRRHGQRTCGESNLMTTMETDGRSPPLSRPSVRRLPSTFVKQHSVGNKPKLVDKGWTIKINQLEGAL